jgi:hypothetical protein
MRTYSILGFNFRSTKRHIKNWMNYRRGTYTSKLLYRAALILGQIKTPRQNITLKCSCHHNYKYNYSQCPQLSTWWSIRSIIKTSTYMLIYKNKEKRSSISMNISNLPTIIYISHNMFYTIKCEIYMWSIMHC